MKLREIFWDTDYNNPSLVKGKSNSTITKKNKELNKIVQNIENLAPTSTKVKQNLSKKENDAITKLSTYDDIIVKKADKGGMFVVMDKTFYRDKLVISDHLSTDTYEVVPNNTDKLVMGALKNLLKKHSKCLTPQEIQYIDNKS